MTYESNASISNKSTRLLFGGIKRSCHRLPSVAVLTALGIPGRSELMDSSTSRPRRRVLNVLRAPRPHAVKICGLSEFGRTLIILESKMVDKDSISSARAKFSSGRGLKKVCGSGVDGSAIQQEGQDVDAHSGSSSSSPSFWNWYRQLAETILLEYVQFQAPTVKH